MRERDLETKFRDTVKRAGGRAVKLVSPGNAGMPDRLVVLEDGKMGFVELKQEGKKPTGLQKAQIRRLLGLGHYVSVLDRSEDICPTIDEIWEWEPRKAEAKIQELESRGCL